MTIEFVLLALLLLSGLYMAWNIGANDVANAIGTSVGSGALTLRQAVVLAGILELCGAFFFGSHVSRTVEEGIVNTLMFSEQPMIVVYGMLSCLIGAGAWLQIASYFGWPVSTTHSIVGAVIGFGLIAGGMEAIYWDNVLFIASSWVLSPLIGGLLSFFIFTFVLRKVFFVNDPLHKAKTVIPSLFFLFIAAITFVISYEGMDHLSITIGFWTALAFSLITGFIASLCCYWYIIHLKSKVPVEEPIYPTHPEILEDLSKAKRALLSAKGLSTGELRYQVGQLAKEVDGCSSSIQETVTLDAGRSEYHLVEKVFSKLQIVSACLMAFAHGANDVANAIGPLAAGVTVLLSGTIIIDETVPIWALLLGGIGIVLGLATWGWRVIETIGRKLTELTPSRGFSAEFGASITILVASRLGCPVSATHTLIGAVLGVGFARGIEALNLVVMRNIVVSWIVTIPIGALMAVVFFTFFRFVFG